jgi:hypothetical protein
MGCRFREPPQVTSAQPCGLPRCTSARGTRRCRAVRVVVLCARSCSAGTRRCFVLPRCRLLDTHGQRRARTQSDTHVDGGPPWSVWPGNSSRIVHKGQMRDCQERRGAQPLFSWPGCRGRAPPGCRGRAPLGAQGAKPPPGRRGRAPLVTTPQPPTPIPLRRIPLTPSRRPCQQAQQPETRPRSPSPPPRTAALQTPPWARRSSDRSPSASWGTG